MLYEGGTRVPLIVRWPGVTPGASVCNVPVVGSDLFPTMLEAAGVATGREGVVDGVSIVPLLGGETSLDREALFWHFPAYLEAYDRNRGPWRTTPAGAVRAGRWKLVEFFEDGRTELYDLASDPGESVDLSAAQPGVRADLHARLLRWREETDAPVPREPEPAYRGD